ncbi:MAG: hypothetical protein HQ567_10025 [Candidatus Nealsonbacteria bacterium]|nr:hypothetical protein [Candidatus Nealsonbacteria bacterium]
MAEWIELDPETLQQLDRTTQDGVEIIVGLSPYDIPDGVRGSKDDQSGRFVIELRYLDNEEEKIAECPGKEVSLIVGKHSKRLYEIHVDVDKLKATEVGLRLMLPEVDDAIEKLSHRPQYANRIRHYEVAKDVISRNSEKLVLAPG